MPTENQSREEGLEGEVLAERRELADFEAAEAPVRDRLERHEAELRRLREDNHYHLEVIVSGTPVAVKANPDHPLEAVVVAALDKTDNHGQPPESWILKDEAGADLQQTRSPESYGLKSGAKLFLGPGAGVGGSRGIAQYVDPAVSRAKFDAEVAEYRYNADTYLRRGWILIRAVYPTVIIAMAAVHLNPMPIITGIELDYTNYDAEPPSVKLVNPFTGEPYKLKELLTLVVQPRFDLPAPQQPGTPLQVVGQPLMLAATLEDVPFLCIAGVREYHQHPAHTGDAWELHRANGLGKLCRLLDVIYDLGVKPLAYGFMIQLIPQFTPPQTTTA